MKKIETMNKNYKDSIFRMIFKDKKELLSLYNAVTGKHYDNPEELEITTLDNALYMNIKNDLSFMIDMRMSLYEHQSTINPNIPLRDLFYVATLYQKLVADKNIYSRSKLRIPTPQFIVFYNGEEEQPERRIMKLSDLYEVKLEEKELGLELTVVQLNINPGYNEKLKESCKTLADYTEYVTRVRSYRKEMSIEQAVDRAIEECIREDILADFLRKQKWEARQVSIFEYDAEKHIKMEKEESFEEGLEQGIQGAVNICRSAKLNKSETKEAILKQYSLTEEKADEYIKLYW